MKKDKLEIKEKGQQRKRVNKDGKTNNGETRKHPEKKLTRMAAFEHLNI